MGTQHSPESRQSSDQSINLPHHKAELRAEHILDHALEVRENFGVMCAIEYLKSNNVDTARIMVVLKNQRH
jgi:hypothetical protein